MRLRAGVLLVAAMAALLAAALTIADDASAQESYWNLTVAESESLTLADGEFTVEGNVEVFGELVLDNCSFDMTNEFSAAENEIRIQPGGALTVRGASGGSSIAGGAARQVQLAPGEEEPAAAAAEVDGDVPEAALLFLRRQRLPAAGAVAPHSAVDRVALLERAGAADDARRVPAGAGRYHDFGFAEVALALEGG